MLNERTCSFLTVHLKKYIYIYLSHFLDRLQIVFIFSVVIYFICFENKCPSGSTSVERIWKKGRVWVNILSLY